MALFGLQFCSTFCSRNQQQCSSPIRIALTHIYLSIHLSQLDPHFVGQSLQIESDKMLQIDLKCKSKTTILGIRYYFLFNSEHNYVLIF